MQYQHTSKKIIKEQESYYKLIKIDRFYIKFYCQMQGSTQVPPHFVPQGNTHYKIVSAFNPNFALTVSGNNHGLSITTYTGDASQRFIILPQGKHYAFVVQSTNTALCVFQDNKQNGGEIRADPGKHNSSWFEINRVNFGQYANRAYVINTFSQGKCLDIAGCNVTHGTQVLQWAGNGQNNQLWLLLPVQQQNNNHQNPWGQQSQGFSNNNQIGGKSNHQNQGFNHSSHHHKDHHKDHKTQNNGYGMQMQGIFKKDCTYAIFSCADPTKCITINDGHAKIFDYQNTINQKFVFQYNQKQKVYHVKCIGNGQFLSCGGLFAGVAIKTKPNCEHGQNWKLEPCTNANFLNKEGPALYFRSSSGHAIDVPNNNFNNGTQLEKHGFHSAPNQTWYVIER